MKRTRGERGPSNRKGKEKVKTKTKAKRLENLSGSAPEDVGTDLQEEREIVGGWTQEEDNYLLSHLNNKERVSWRGVCNSLNRKFVNKKRTCKECELRWELLKQQMPKLHWNPNEELVLTLGLNIYSHRVEEVALLLQTRSVDEIREHIKKQMQVLAHLVKANKIDDYVTAAPVHKLQMQVCLAALFRSLANDKEVMLEVNEVQRELQLTREECLGFLRAISQGRVNREEELYQSLEGVLESLQNGLFARPSVDTEDDGLNEVLHRRVDEPRVMAAQHFQTRQPNGQVRDYYVLSYIYPVPNEPH